MKCQNCTNILPEGAMFCNICGADVMVPQLEPQPIPPQPIPPQPIPPQPIPLQPAYTQVTPVSPIPVVTDIPVPTAKKSIAKSLIATALIILLFGGAIGGHFMGWYSLPFLPERAEAETNHANASNTADFSLNGSLSSEPGENSADSSGTDTLSEEYENWDGYDETGFDYATFGYGVSGIVLDSIQSLHIQLNPEMHKEIYASDFSDFRLTKDGQEIAFSFSDEGLITNEYMHEDVWHNNIYFSFSPPLTEPGDYQMTFTLFGKTREVWGGNSFGQPVEGLEETAAKPMTMPEGNYNGGGLSSGGEYDGEKYIYTLSSVSFNFNENISEGALSRITSLTLYLDGQPYSIDFLDEKFKASMLNIYGDTQDDYTYAYISIDVGFGWWIEEFYAEYGLNMFQYGSIYQMELGYDGRTYMSPAWRHFYDGSTEITYDGYHWERAYWHDWE